MAAFIKKGCISISFKHTVLLQEKNILTIMNTVVTLKNVLILCLFKHFKI